VTEYSFDAAIIRHEGMDAAYIEFPYDVKELFGTNGNVKIVALFDGRVEYRGIVANMGLGCHCIGINKAVRGQLNKTVGDVVRVSVRRDDAPREVDVPDDLEALLNAHPSARQFYDSLSYSNRKAYADWIVSAKRENTRAERLQATLRKLTGGDKRP